MSANIRKMALLFKIRSAESANVQLFCASCGTAPCADGAWPGACLYGWSALSVPQCTTPELKSQREAWPRCTMPERKSHHRKCAAIGRRLKVRRLNVTTTQKACRNARRLNVTTTLEACRNVRLNVSHNTETGLSQKVMKYGPRDSPFFQRAPFIRD